MAAVCCFTLRSLAQTDTTKKGNVNIIYKNGQLVVVEDGIEKEVDKVTFGPSDGPKKLKRVDFNALTFDWGFNNYLFNGSLAKPAEIENLALNTWPSMNFHLGIFQQKLNFANYKLGLITGIGFEFNDFRFTNNIDFKRNDSTGTVTFEDRELTGWRRNKLTTKFIEVPLQLQYLSNPRYPDKSFKIQAGINFGYRITSYFKTVWFDPGKSKNKERDHFFLNDFRTTAVVKMGYGKFQLYGAYSLTPLFQEGRGPELYPVSAGLVVWGW